MQRLARSWALMKSSARVLQRDKELVALPLMGLAVAVAVFAASFGLMWATGSISFDETSSGLSGPGYIIAILASLTGAAVVQFFAASVVAGALERLGGGDPTIGSSITKASQHLAPILGWAGIDWTVGAILRTIREEMGLIGRILAGLMSFAWAAVSFLVLPVILVEDLGPIEGLNRSKDLLRTTWGENVAAQFGFSLLGFLAVIPGVVIGFLLASVVPPLGIAVIVLWVLAVVGVISALTGIFKAALYRYATSGMADADFGQHLPAAFAVK